MNKLQVYHFHNGCGGGVLSVIRNLIRFSRNTSLENHVIHAVNRKKIQEYKIERIEGAVTQQLYYYDPKNNFYYTCKQLAKLLPNEKAVIVAHDWLELGMASNLGLQNPVVQILHGNYDYYYDLAIKNKNSVDSFLCVAELIKKKLSKKLPERQNDIYEILLPVTDIAFRTHKRKPNQILFLGRCEISKGYDKLPLIDEKLSLSNTDFQWHIIGSGSLHNDNQRQWKPATNIIFYGDLPSEKVYSLLPTFDFIVLPSLAEGMPVSIIEAMKAGVVPIVNDLDGGIQQIVVNGENGFRIANNNPSGFAQILINLNEDISFFETISQNASTYAHRNFNPVNNTTLIENIIISNSLSKKIKTRNKKYGSFLDEPWIPNLFVLFLRYFTSIFKKIIAEKQK